MLSADEICDAIKQSLGDDEDGLFISPTPDLDSLMRRGATSVDLRLGRWFLSFKQTKTSSVSLFDDKNDLLILQDEVERDKKTQPAGRESSVDETIYGMQRGDRISRTRQHFVPFTEEYVLHPGSFVLGATLEWLALPACLSGYVTGKSRLGRHGLVIETAAGIHPWFSGCLTLEMGNIGEVPLRICPGMPICQVFFHKVGLSNQSKAPSSQATAIEKRGMFSGRRRPVLVPPTKDETLRRLRDNAKRNFS